jgi:uncharacterized protein
MPTNRLAAETSPYLLQHAHNPVDWYAWGDEAFEASRRQDKPIFLSVGYSTCYWCHVMERQCFENSQIASLMNEHFINIKVDREERPDVDQLYMLAVQIITRQGGWPMSVFLTPDLRPFFGGTYFPPEDSYGRPGFPRLLTSIHAAWQNRRDEILGSADQLSKTLAQLAQPRSVAAPIRIDLPWIEKIIRESVSDFDPVHGGFGSAPKFPRQTLLELLLIYLRDHEEKNLQAMLQTTLLAMAHGGIRDHLGGAFHRYSTDAQWLVPHFEIMLYDNAMLLWTYSEAHRQTPDPRYAAIARGIADFILAEMTSPQGTFYTALDAEVDAREGDNYLWTRQEIQEALVSTADPAEIARFSRVYGLDGGPNFADPHHAHDAPEKNVLYLAEPGSSGISALLDANLEKMRKALYAARKTRKQPLLDTKILTSWNALMIRGLARAGQVLFEPRYTAAAAKAADELLARHRDPTGGLFRVSTAGGQAKFPAFLDDYAFLIQALFALESTDAVRRHQANELATIMQHRFGDPQNGAFFYTDESAVDLIIRQKVGSDSPLPSGNGVAAQVMLALGEPQVVAQTISTFAEQMQNFGESASALVQAALEYVQKYGPLNIESAEANDIESSKSPRQVAEQILSVSSQWISPMVLQLNCTIQPGYHINAADAAPPTMPTRLLVPVEAEIQFPGVILRQFAYDDSPLPIYEKELAIRVIFKNPRPPSGKLQLALTYQPCTETACLPTVTRRFSVDVP